MCRSYFVARLTPNDVSNFVNTDVDFSQCARNGLYSSKPGGTRYFHKSGSDILWSHIRSLLEIENSSPLRKCRLSDSHVQLTSYNKVKFLQ